MSELAAELNVSQADIVDWLIKGCPGQKFRTIWLFNLKRVMVWLHDEGIQTPPIKPRRSQVSLNLIDPRWLGKRCPVCIEKGFFGEKAGKIYTQGTVLEGAWRFRRIAVPCGHSIEIAN